MSIGITYRPGSAFAHDAFFDAWCASCRWWDQEDGCPISCAAMAHEIDDDEYPLEWCRVDNRPTCTEYHHCDDDQEAATPRCLKTPDMFEVLG